MKFLQRIPLADGPLKILFGLFTGLGIMLLLYAFLSNPRGENLAPTLRPTLTKPAPTLTPVIPTPTAFTAALPTYLPLAPPEPSPTRFYIIPADATAIPTPPLPAAAPFPTSCDGPGRMNILLIGLD